MVNEEHHEELVKGITEQMKSVLTKSGQAIYLYLDDNHKVCNKKFADLLGYKSPKEWADLEAPLADVVEEDQGKVIKVYMSAFEHLNAGFTEVRMKNTKSGKIVKTKMIVVPIGHAGHIFTAHFFDEI
jgi:PAS domain-containing protein